MCRAAISKAYLQLAPPLPRDTSRKPLRLADDLLRLASRLAAA